jgi:hypothetical protein
MRWTWWDGRGTADSTGVRSAAAFSLLLFISIPMHTRAARFTLRRTFFFSSRIHSLLLLFLMGPNVDTHWASMLAFDLCMCLRVWGGVRAVGGCQQVPQVRHGIRARLPTVRRRMLQDP